MSRKDNAKVVALGGILGALAIALMFLGGAIPAAVIACPVLASLVLLPVYCEYGWKWGLVWYIAVSVLALLLTVQKEAAILFIFFGYYPMLKKFIGRLRNKIIKWLIKLFYLNTVPFVAYGLMIFVFQLEQVIEDFREVERIALLVMLALANLTFVVYDLVIDRLELFYHLRLRPKLKL